MILREVYGLRVSVETPSEMFHLDAVLKPGASIPLLNNREEGGAFVLQGSITIA